MSEKRAIPKVVLADDHPIIRYGIRSALESRRLAHVMGEASSPLELFSILSNTPCDIVITDFSMPDDHSRDGLYLIDRIMRTHPAITVVVLTALRNGGLLNAILEKGAKGLLEKEGNIGELGAALKSVSQGNTYVSPSLRALMENCKVHDKCGNEVAFTEAEIEVLRLFAYEGLTSMQIAERINRSRKTVSRHKRNAQRKLRLETNQELLEYCRTVDLSTGASKDS